MAEQNNGGEQNPGNGQQPGAGGGQQQQQTQNPTGGGQQQQQQPGSGGGAGGNNDKVFSYKEDRTDWTPRHRLNEVSTRATKAEQERDALKAQLERESGRVRALAGVEKQDPKEQEKEELRNIIYELAPELGALKGLTREQLQEVMDAAKSARGASQASWERHALGMLGELDTEAADILEVEKLTPTQQNSLRRAYREAAQDALQTRAAAMQRGERDTLETIASDRDFVARHEAGDKALVKEFVKAYLDDWYEPARRAVTTSQQRRQFRPVPRGERTRQLPAGGEKKYDLNKDDEFQKALLEARASGGRE